MSDLTRPEKTGKEEEEPKKPSTEILRNEIREGLGALEGSAIGLAISGISAGLDIGFGPFLMAVVRTKLTGEFSEPILALIGANLYAVGFLFVVLGRSELFTEQTTLAVLPVLGGHSRPRALVRLWAIVLAANLAGGAIFAAILVLVGPALGIIDPVALGQIAEPLLGHPWWVTILSAVLAGWLMGLLSWLVAASRDTISQIVIVWLITTAIGIGHLHHVVAGSVQLFGAYFAGQNVALGELGLVLLWSTIGNILGGAFFVGVIKFGHTTYGKRPTQHNLEARVPKEEED
ncbi:formate/nitrite transporter family protein [Lignipirellula cremea]|uniref:formate/nitrite transporter family protein n=1 Tax=Lignipirellula cremea TaxID=2528010 RepID=UPI0018D219AD|nr:formate/nitrite transporter family protein [Lignipirellula cremea]